MKYVLLYITVMHENNCVLCYMYMFQTVYWCKDKFEYNCLSKYVEVDLKCMEPNLVGVASRVSEIY